MRDDPVELTVDELLPELATKLDEVLRTNGDKISSELTLYHAKILPAITIRDYLNRFKKYVTCGPECYILALVYIERIMRLNPGLYYNKLTQHRYHTPPHLTYSLQIVINELSDRREIC